MSALERPVLLYDSDCRFCRWTIRVVQRLDRHGELAQLPMLDPEAAELLARLPTEQRYSSWHLALEDGSLVGRGAGLRDLLRALRLTRPVAPLVAVVPDALLDRAYRTVAEHRSRLGRLVPDGPAPRRFP